MSRNIFALLLILLLQLIACDRSIEAGPVNDATGTGFGPAQLGVIVNDDDPESRKIADYYMERKAYRPGHSPGRPRTASAACQSPRHLRTGSMMHSAPRTAS
jgi:hypothetical protein